MNAVPRNGTTAVTAGQPLLTGGQATRDEVLTLKCAERPGIVHEVSGSLAAPDCDIVEN
jgi:hypothetical protein